MNATAPLPQRWNWFVNGFRRYVRRYVRKHFHAVRLSNSGYAIPDDGGTFLIALNHPSWWDPMIGCVLADLFPTAIHYAAIDADMLKKYKSFNKLGFFGVDQSSLRGAAEFLKVGTAILSQSNHVVWVTAQGTFADVRTRPLNLRSGVGHLAAKVQAGWVVPMALEYSYWMERTPEALVRIGEPIPMGQERLTGKQFTEKIEKHLTTSLDVLNQEVQQRDPALFTELLGGTVGVGGVYDAFRRSLALVQGQKFEAGHGTNIPGRDT